MFTYIHQSLKRGYQQSWLKFLFSNTSLAKLIAQEQGPSAFEFFNNYLSSWWWNRWWFKSCIESSEAKHQFDSILKSLQHLKDKGIFTEDNGLAVANHANPNSLAYGLTILQRAGLLTEEHRMLVANHAKPDDLASALTTLQRAGILTEDHRALVANQAKPYNLAYALSYLQRAGLLTEEHRMLVANHTYLDRLVLALSYLQKYGILKDNCLTVINHDDPSYLASALTTLQRAGIYTEANRTLVANHTKIDGLNSVLFRLEEYRILTHTNFNLVANHTNIYGLDSALFRLGNYKDYRFVTQTNFNLVANHANPYGLISAFSYLDYSRFTTQADFALLAAPNHEALVSQEAHRLIWRRIPARLLTLGDFYRLVRASEEANPMAALERVANQILGVQAQVQAGHAAAFNPGQSTHTASVHRTVSESASRLMASYGAGLELEAKIKEIKTYVMGLDESAKHDAAKRCIARITEADYTFTDSSNVSTRQLLALAWVAIHDETKCKATLEDATTLFLEGLYEIQRGYNLDDLGNDLGGEDRPICTAGTFNKLMEKLNGIHTDVEVYYITHAGLCIKFPKVVAEHALSYLNRLSNPETATGYLSMKTLLDNIKENGLGPIWDKIKSVVKAILWDEFKEAYANHPEHPQFSAMIDNGHHSNAPDLTELYNRLEASPGRQALLYQLEQKSLEEHKSCLGLPQHSLWATRHESPVAQNAFDRQYGLVLKP